MKQKLLGKNQKVGLILIGLSILLWVFRPFQDCKFYELACKTASATITPIFILLAGILLAVGVIKLVKKNKR